MKNLNSLILLNRNSKNNINRLILQINKIINYDSNLKTILIIDNKSDDKSGELIYENVSNKLDKKIILIQNMHDYGMGGSLKISLNYILDYINTENVIVMHTSGRTDIYVLYKRFLTKNIDNYNYILMSRYNKKSIIENYNTIRNIGNKFFNLLVLIFTGKYLEDHGSGIFLIKKSFLGTLNFNNFTNDSFFNPQMNIVIAKDNNIKYVPVEWGDSKVKSHLNIYSYSLKLLFFLIKYFFLRERVFLKSKKEFVTKIKINK